VVPPRSFFQGGRVSPHSVLEGTQFNQGVASQPLQSRLLCVLLFGSLEGFTEPSSPGGGPPKNFGWTTEARVPTVRPHWFPILDWRHRKDSALPVSVELRLCSHTPRKVCPEAVGVGGVFTRFASPRTKREVFVFYFSFPIFPGTVFFFFCFFFSPCFNIFLFFFPLSTFFHTIPTYFLITFSFTFLRQLFFFSARPHLFFSLSFLRLGYIQPFNLPIHSI